MVSLIIIIIISDNDFHFMSYNNNEKFSGRPLGFYRISTTKKTPKISTKYRPHSTLSTKYRPQKFLEKRAFTIFTFKS